MDQYVDVNIYSTEEQKALQSFCEYEVLLNQYVHLRMVYRHVHFRGEGGNKLLAGEIHVPRIPPHSHTPSVETLVMHSKHIYASMHSTQLQTSLTIKTETVAMDGVLNSVQVSSSTTPPLHPDGVAMGTSGGSGKVVVSFVTKVDIASEGWRIYSAYNLLVVVCMEMCTVL